MQNLFDLYFLILKKIIIYIYFTTIAASSTVIDDDLRSRSHVEYLIPHHNISCAHFVLKIDEKHVAPLAACFNTI